MTRRKISNGKVYDVVESESGRRTYLRRNEDYKVVKSASGHREYIQRVGEPADSTGKTDSVVPEYNQLMTTITDRIKSLVFFTGDVTELPKADRQCPRCEGGTLHKDSGIMTHVYRCSSCSFEGARHN